MNNSNYSFRLGQEEDSEAIYYLVKQLAVYESKLEELKMTHDILHKAMFSNKKSVWALLCEYNSKPVGIAIWCERFSPYAGGINLLMIDLYVEPEHRKNGLGKEFFLKLKEISEENNYVRIEWFVNSKNHDAKQFYTKQGGQRLEYSEHWKLELAQ